MDPASAGFSLRVVTRSVRVSSFSKRLLLQFGKTYADVGLGSDLIGTFCAEHKTLGDFLGHVGMVVADRVTKTRVTKRLPQLVFVVTSSADVTGEANRIRRAGTQALAPAARLASSRSPRLYPQ
jgi:hypothetical protein